MRRCPPLMPGKLYNFFSSPKPAVFFLHYSGRVVPPLQINTAKPCQNLIPSNPMSSSHKGFILQWLAKYESQTRFGSDEEIRTEVAGVLKHYEKHYALRAEAAAMQMAAISMLLSMENGFLWLSEWRPSVIFHVAYAEIGNQMESELAELLKGTNSSNLAGLTSNQLLQINDLHCRTVQEEDKLSHRLSALQKIAAAAINGEGFQRALDGMGEELQFISGEGDRLRVDTFKRMLDILTPPQCIQILVPALRLQFSLRDSNKC